MEWTKEEINQLAYKWYFEVIKKLSYIRPINNFNNLKISNYFKNYKIKTTQGLVWKYNRHHIIEINISGAELWNNPLVNKKFINTESIIVTLEEHAFLHYLIVLTQRTYPNDGITNQVSYNEWNAIIENQCVKFNLPYITNWKEYINRMDEFLKIQNKSFEK